MYKHQACKAPADWSEPSGSHA